MRKYIVLTTIKKCALCDRLFNDKEYAYEHKDKFICALCVRDITDITDTD